ncbi:MAG: hypothetical protein RIQ81_1768 [Pseudomonadota bacterium]
MNGGGIFDRPWLAAGAMIPVATGVFTMAVGSLPLLFVDDDPFLREKVTRELDGATSFDGRAFQVFQSADAAMALSMAPAISRQSSGNFISLTDLSLDGKPKSGMSLIRELRREYPSACIIAFSDFDDPQTVRECLISGADDFISKRSEGHELIHRVNMAGNVLRHARLENSRTSQESSRIHISPTIAAIQQRAARIVPSAVSSVLVYGESGTGKEVVADVFASLVGSKGPFLRVNCGAIAPTLLESELFGHVRGAFTGATSDRRGFFEAASGGWIFLDEVATLTPSAQVALLRVLENQEVVRLGSSRPVTVSVRIIAATNERLDALVASGKFRKDLWQRLREVEIELTPLRDRRREVAGLVQHFCATMPGGPYEVTEPVMEILGAASWSDGNIRELRNCLRAMTEFATPDRRLTPLSLPKWLWQDPGVVKGEARPGGDDDVAGRMPGAMKQLVLDVPPSLANPYHFEDLADLALVTLIRRIFRERGKVSLRSLSRIVGLSRGTIATKLRAAADKGIFAVDEMQSLFAMQGPEDK